MFLNIIQQIRESFWRSYESKLINGSLHTEQTSKKVRKNQKKFAKVHLKKLQKENAKTKMKNSRD